MKLFWIDNRLYINDNNQQIELDCDFPLALEISYKAGVDLDYDFTGHDLHGVIDDFSDFFGCDPCRKGAPIWDKLEEIQNILNIKFTHEDLQRIIEELMLQAVDLVIPGYRLGRVSDEELEVIVLEGLRVCLANSDSTGLLHMVWEKLAIDNIKEELHSIDDLKAYVEEIAKDKMVNLSISDMMHCYNMIHKNDNLIIFMNHKDSIKDFIDYFKIDYEDFIGLVVGNSFYEPTENYLVSDGKNKLFTYDDELLINDLLSNMTTECAEWIIKHY